MGVTQTTGVAVGRASKKYRKREFWRRRENFRKKRSKVSKEINDAFLNPMKAHVMGHASLDQMNFDVIISFLTKWPNCGIMVIFY